jgi:hypothetical protein
MVTPLPSNFDEYPIPMHRVLQRQHGSTRKQNARAPKTGRPGAQALSRETAQVELATMRLAS